MATTTAKTKTDIVNMVFLAGTLKFDPQVFDNAVKCLIDTGQKQSIPCGVRKGQYGDDGLAAKLALFAKGDSIKVVAILEPYGVKQEDGTYKNGMAIRITEIKTETPQHRRTAATKPAMDDDIPF